MNFPEPSKEVKELCVLNQDLYEIKKIMASLTSLPDGNLKNSLSQRVALYLSTGQSVKDLQDQLTTYQNEVKALESRIDDLLDENPTSLEVCEPNPNDQSGFGFGALTLSFLLGNVIATFYNLWWN